MGRPLQKFEREVVALLKELGCTDITLIKSGKHGKISMCLPNGVTRVITVSTSPKNADHVIKETRRLVRHILEGRHQ